MPEPFPIVYGKLNLKGTDHTFQWMAQQPFRPLDLLLWGTDSTTMVRSFTVGLSEQIAHPFFFDDVLRAPWFPVESLAPAREVGMYEIGPLRDLLDGVKLASDLTLRVNPALGPFKTASPGVFLRLRITGALQHAIVYGLSVD